MASATEESQGGDGGNIVIEANNVLLADGAKITTRTSGSGMAGNITFYARGTLTITDISSKNGLATQISSDSKTEKANDAGKIAISAGTLYLKNGGNINTSAVNASGGNITVETPVFVVLDQGEMKAQADEGRGGNIRIVANQFIDSPDSLVSASSRVGIDGEVDIDAPETDYNQMLIVLPSKFKVKELVNKSCAARLDKKADSFIKKGRGGVNSDELEGVTGSYSDKAP